MKTLSALFAALMLAAGPITASAQTAMQPNMAIAAPSYEYVQQAASLSYDGRTLTLEGLAPATIFFSDRPYRLAGHVETAVFANLWDAPAGTFAQSPPNAAISVLGETNAAPAIVTLTSAQVDGDSISYGVRLVSGQPPETARNVALFIDHGPQPTMGYYPHHPVPGPYCYHAPQDPACHYYPYHPYPPYHPYYYHPGAAFAAGAAVGAAIARNRAPTYSYPIPSGALPAHCHINNNHTRMICSVPIAQ